MELKRANIERDYERDKLVTYLGITLTDGNGMMLKAKAELYASIMDGIGALIDAKIAEFAERYGEEVIQYAHHNTDALLDKSPMIVQRTDTGCREVQVRLLDKAFPDE